MPVRTLLSTLVIALACGLGVGVARALPIVPTHDDEVIERLPAINGSRGVERRLRERLAQQPQDAQAALVLAQRNLDRAHELGDPRFAGMAMSAIAGWPDAASMPDAVLLMRASLQQYLHEFDASAASLQQLLARPGAPRPQAWLTLATVRRVQGRYVDSDRACTQVAAAGAALHGRACQAENAALRGDVARARAVFGTLLAAAAGQPPATRGWLETSVAELEQRAGNAAAAEAAFRAALAVAADPYATLACADFLIEQGRPAQALALLNGQSRSDAVLLRLAIAGTQARAAPAAADVAEMRERIALANERPDAPLTHGREQAMFALAIDHDPTRALALARRNVDRQREPLDLLVLAQAARASADAGALREALALAARIGLHDQRIEGLR